MSIRAYKLIEIKTEKEPSFNATHNFDVFLLGNDYEGILSYERERVEKELKKDNLKKENKIILEKILKDMGDKDYVEYYCY